MTGKLGQYLASPYSSPDRDVRAMRYWYAVQGLAFLYCTAPGLLHFSPIVHSHPVAEYDKALADIGWVALDLGILPVFSGLTILKVPGWDTSVGVAHEIARAEKLKMPIHEILESELR